MERLQSEVVERIKGPAWDGIRASFINVSETLLGVDEEATGQLTTIYVKFGSPKTKQEPYAVVWIKNSKQLVIGLALPASIEDPVLIGPPQGMKYKGLTKYLCLKPGEMVPTSFPIWANAAYCNLIQTHNAG